MIDYSPRKRDRPKEDDDVPESMQPNKKLLVDSFTSLKIGGEGGAVYEPGSVIECGSDMDTDNTSVAVVCLAPTTSLIEDSLQNQHSENVYSMLKNGTRKYGRRVDYLVDELIKKSQRTYANSSSSSDFDLEAILPSSIGPHPLTDRPLGKLWPTVVPTVEGASLMKANQSPQPNRENGRFLNSRYCDGSSSDSDNDSEMEEDNNFTDPDQHCFEMEEIIKDCVKVKVEANSPSHAGQHDTNGCSSSINKAHPAGSITHSDWGIEDVT